ncbi:MAG: site-2 protease family protein [bacterium]|nr:site-2 protease family protein [bacterium]
MNEAIPFIFNIAILIFSIVVHEVSHGYAALMQGDKTAQYEGRLTLNPLKHLEWFGSVLLPTISYLAGGFIFGWAKPVPYNPHNLRNKRWGPAYVAAAGPLVNISIAVVFGLIIRFLPGLGGILPGDFILNFLNIASLIVLLNLVLAFFNLVPIPPLDGSKLLFAFLPYRWHHVQIFMEQYGLFLFLMFIFFFSRLIFPIVIFSFKLITGSLPIF